MTRSKTFNFLTKFLIILLVLIFVFSNINNIFNNKSSNYAIKIGRVEYSIPEFFTILKDNIKNVSGYYDNNITKDKLIKIKHNRIEEIINTNLILMEAKSLGIVVNDAILKKEILTMPFFFKDGTFNRNFFDKTIKNYNKSQQEFVDTLRNNVIENTFLHSLSLDKFNIPKLDGTILNNIVKTRVIKLIMIPFLSFKLIVKPSDYIMKSIYKKDVSHFIVSEKRDIEYIIVSANSLKKDKKKVIEKKLVQIHSNKKVLFIESLQRSIKQIQFSSLDNAKRARYDLIKGGDFKLVANKYSPHFRNYHLGPLDITNFDDKIMNALINLKINGISDVIETPFGFYVFKIETISLKKNKSFIDVKNLIKTEYNKVINNIDILKKINKIQKELDNNKDLGLIAKKFSQQLRKIRVSNTINKNIDIANDQLFISNSFQIKLQSQSKLFIVDSGNFCALRVTSIVPRKLIEFHLVRSQIKNIWYNNIMSLLAKKIEFLGKTNDHVISNKIFFDNSKIKNINTKISNAYATNKIGINLYKEAFKLVKNQHSKPFIDFYQKKVLLLQLININTLSKKTMEQYRILYEKQINEMEREVILTDILKNLKKKFLVKVNPSIISYIE